MHAKTISPSRLVRGIIPILAFGLWLCPRGAWADSKSAADSGGPFKVSFLESEPPLEDTCQLLTKSGFPDATVAIFKNLVRFYNENGNLVDRAKFPPARGGYYEFQNFDDYTNRLLCPLFRTPAKQKTLVCFDMVCLLLHDAGYCVPALKQDFESKGILLLRTNVAPASVSYEEWHGGVQWLLPTEKDYEFIVGRTRSKSEGLLNQGFRAARRASTVGLNCGEIFSNSFPVFVSGLKRSGFVFPTNFMVGFVFVAHPDLKCVWADHAFLCFSHDGKWICLEKDGMGPYIRAEFGSAEDLGHFVMADYLMEPREDPLAVSLNDRLIRLWSGK
jgi:hypothetical protein